MSVTMSRTNNIPHPVIIFVRGLPGSGKSFLTSKLRAAIDDDVVVLDPDTIDFKSDKYVQHEKDLTLQEVNPALFAYRFLRGQAYEAIAKHQIVIWNQPFTNLEIFHKMIANLRLEADKYKIDLPIMVIEVEIDPSIASNRIDTRKNQGGHGPTHATFNRFINDYTSFRNEGYDTVTVQGDDDIELSVRHIITELQTLNKV